MVGKYKLGSGPINTNWGPGLVNTNWRSGPINTNWEPGSVNTNWQPGTGTGLGAKQRVGSGNKKTYKNSNTSS